jgi:glycosyltransferase involved in cell wall biosynthesis
VLGVGYVTSTPVALFRHINARLNPWTRWALPRLCGRFIAVSASLRTNLLLQGLPAEHVQLLYNPIDTVTYRVDSALREKSRSALGVHEGQVVVGYVGGLEATKGPFHLAPALDGAMKKEPCLIGLWITPEAKHGRLRAALAPENLNRHRLRGWARDVSPYYAAMDVLAVPSVWPEVFGRVAAEAQACGVPVLGSRIGGIPEAIQEDISGQLVTPGDIEAWTGALLAFAALKQERRQEMGLKGPSFIARRCASEVIAQQLTDMLQRHGPISR